MKWSRWTPEACSRLMDLYFAGYSAKQIAAMMGRTEHAVRLRLLGSGYSSRKVKIHGQPAPETVVEPEPLPAMKVETPDEQYYEARARAEMEAQEARRDERSKIEEAKRQLLEDRIAEDFRTHLCDLPRSPIRVVAPAPPEPRTDPMTAVLVVSDAHIGQIVCPQETGHFGFYNPWVTLARVRHLELEVASIVSERPVEKLLVLFAGDIIHGRLGHSLEEDSVPISQQVDLAMHIFFHFLTGLSAHACRIEVHGVCGNHGRFPAQRKMPTERRFSNLDTIFFNSLSALCQHSGLENLQFAESIAPRAVIDVGAHRLQLQHGDQVRGGIFAAMGMSKEVTHSTLRHAQNGRKAVDYYICGDKHTPTSLSFGKSSWIVNGSFVGPDNFGLNFAAAPPSQTLFFLHPVRGKCETHEIRLDFAPLSMPMPYPLKPSLEELVSGYGTADEVIYENTTKHTIGRRTLANAA
jgi:transposase-like protein